MIFLAIDIKNNSPFEADNISSLLSLKDLLKPIIKKQFYKKFVKSFYTSYDRLSLMRDNDTFESKFNDSWMYSSLSVKKIEPIYLRSFYLSLLPNILIIAVINFEYDKELNFKKIRTLNNQEKEIINNWLQTHEIRRYGLEICAFNPLIQKINEDVLQMLPNWQERMEEQIKYILKILDEKENKLSYVDLIKIEKNFKSHPYYKHIQKKVEDMLNRTQKELEENLLNKKQKETKAKMI